MKGLLTEDEAFERTAKRAGLLRGGESGDTIRGFLEDTTENRQEIEKARKKLCRSQENRDMGRRPFKEAKKKQLEKIESLKRKNRRPTDRSKLRTTLHYPRGTSFKRTHLLICLCHRIDQDD